MTAASNAQNSPPCGGRVRVTYVYENDKLVYSGIHHKNEEILEGFPKEGHFLIQITDAIVRTSEKIMAYKDPNYCTLEINTKPGAPKLTTTDMRGVSWDCEINPVRKKAQMAEKKTHPVIAEKIHILDSYPTPFQCQPRIECEYKPHLPRLLPLYPIAAIKRHEESCRTGNLVEFSPPFVLFYGSKYLYNIHMETDKSYLLTKRGTRIITFYGRIYESTCSDYWNPTTSYFVEAAPPVCEKEQSTSRSKVNPSQDDSDIDDYDDDVNDGGSDIDTRTQFIRNAAAAAMEETRKTPSPECNIDLQESGKEIN